MTSAMILPLYTLLVILTSPGIHGYEITTTHNLGNLKSHTYSLDVVLKVKGDIVWKNSDTTSTEVTVQKSATNKIDVDNIDFEVTVDETNKVIKVISDVRAPNEESEGSRAYLSKLLPVILALWWSVLFSPYHSRPHTLLGMVAMGLLLLGYSRTSADIQDDIRADITITMPRHMVFLEAKLSTLDGSIQAPPGVPQVTNTSCVSSGRLCDMCCYGNGVCDAGACMCESGFSASDNCEAWNGTIPPPPPIGGAITVIISAENNVTNDAREFTFCTTAEASSGENTFEIINRTAAINPAFSIEVKHFENLGYYITAINGLTEDSTNSLYWGFGRRTLEGDCLYPVGVSSYYPWNLEHLLFTYITYDMFNTFPTCTVANQTTALNFDYNLNDRCYNPN